MLTNQIAEMSTRTFWAIHCEQCRSIVGDLYPDPRDLDVELNVSCPMCGAGRVEVREVTR